MVKRCIRIGTAIIILSSFFIRLHSLIDQFDTSKVIHTIKQLEASGNSSGEVIRADGEGDFSNLTVDIINTTFTVASNTTYILNHRAYSCKFVTYLRNETEIHARGTQGNCNTSSIEVLCWLMERVNKKGGTLIMAYGGLLHAHREKNFVNNSTGKYLDNDFDLWSSAQTLYHIGMLEPELFRRFGWTVRAFVDPPYTVFMQVLMTCGHVCTKRASKIISTSPAIELYPLVHVGNYSGHTAVRDMWSNNIFSESVMLPPRHMTLYSAGTTLHIQTPNDPLRVLECMYGDWRVYSPRSGNAAQHCTEVGKSG